VDFWFNQRDEATQEPTSVAGYGRDTIGESNKAKELEEQLNLLSIAANGSTLVPLVEF